MKEIMVAIKRMMLPISNTFAFILQDDKGAGKNRQTTVVTIKMMITGIIGRNKD
jgi:hypothetical protein